MFFSPKSRAPATAMDVDGAGGAAAPTDESALSDLQLLEMVRDLVNDLPNPEAEAVRKRKSKHQAQGQLPSSVPSPHSALTLASVTLMHCF